MKILILQLKRIGDLILTTPAIAVLRESFPDAHVTLAVSNECAELLPAIANVDRILVARRNLRDIGPFLSVTGKRFDYCIDFTRNDRSALLTLLSVARRRVASYRVRDQSKTRARLYTDLVGVRVRDMHTIDYNLALLEPLGVRAVSTGPQLSLPQTAHEKADALRRDSKITRPYLILHPGSARRQKLWEPERWAEVIERFGQNNDFDLVLTSGRVCGRTSASRSNFEAHAAKSHRSLWEDRFAYAGGVDCAGTTPGDSRFGSRAFGSSDAHAAGDPVRTDESVSLETQGKSRTDFAR